MHTTRWLTRLALWLGWSCVFAWLCGLAGDLHWALELFSHFLPFYVPLLLIAALACRGRRGSALIFGLTALLQIGQIARSALDFPSTPPANLGPPLNALSFNLYLHNPTPARALQEIHRHRADLVFLTELTPGFSAEREQLERSHRHHCSFVGDHPFGLGLYSRHPLATCEVRQDTAGYPWIRAQLGDGTVVYGMHPPPPLGPVLAAHRDGHLRELARHIAEEKRALVLGDLNMTPWSPVYTRFLQEAGLDDARRGAGLLPSWTPWPGGMPLLALDHVLVKGGRVDSLARGAASGSDHHPMQARLRFTLPDGDAARSGGTPRPGGR